MALVLILGSVWAHEAWGSYWAWDPKETSALFTWLIYGVYLHTRTLRGWRGTRSALDLALRLRRDDLHLLRQLLLRRTPRLRWGVVNPVAGRSLTKAAATPQAKGASAETKKPSTRQAVVGLSLALAIVVAAWFIGGRAGFDEIGEGGINRQFLPEVGEAAPDFVALDSTASGVWLHDFKGKPVWLTFWGSWCPPCRSEMPEIEAAYRQLAPEGLVLMAVSVDEPYEVSLAFAQGLGATFPILNVRYRELIADRYDVYNYPTHIFIDENGIVQKIIPGQLDEETALAEGRALLTSSTAASAS